MLYLMCVIFGVVNGVIIGLVLACVVHFRSHPDCPAAPRDDDERRRDGLADPQRCKVRNIRCDRCQLGAGHQVIDMPHDYERPGREARGG